MTDSRLVRPSWRGRTNLDALTIACIEHAEQIARQLLAANGRGHLAHPFVITQGSYQAGAGDPKSAGTHDLGGVGDARWCGHPECLRALRLAGLAAWHRTPKQGNWPDHIHFVVIGHPLLANAAAKQVSAYLAGRNGLANGGADDGPRLTPIPRPVWPWPPKKQRPADIRAALKSLRARLKVAGPVEAARIRKAIARLMKIKKR